MSAVESTLRKARGLARAGDRAGAADVYLDLLARFPKNRRARQGLGEVTCVASPDDAARINEALTRLKGLAANGHSSSAAQAAQDLIAMAPSVPQIHNEVGTIYVSLSMGDAAEAAFERAHRLAPDHPDFASNYGSLLTARDRELDAIPIFNAVLARQPEHLGARRGLGRAYLGLGQSEAAIAAFDTVLVARPTEADTLANRAAAHFSLGHREAAVADMRRARSIDPARVEFMRMYCHMAKVAADDPIIATMETALQQPGRIGQDLLRLHFALAKSRHGVGHHAKAFAHWDVANRIVRSLSGYDIAEDHALFAQIKSLASARPAPLDLPPASRRRPIFIVGMPRSGTSLLEQILSSHPDVHGAGEIADLSDAVNAVGGLAGPLEPDALQDLRRLYLNGVAQKTPDAPWVVDKMMVNFRLIGQIVTALPEAKIIHIRRDPMATCWSNFRHFFPNGGQASDYGNDLGDLGAYWRLYDDLMRFWDATYPGQVHTLDYEALVADPKRETAAALAYIGLPWDEACLRFDENTRAVTTTSAAQVRQCLYTGSSDDWRAYDNFLGPLRAALGDAVTARGMG